MNGQVQYNKWIPTDEGGIDNTLYEYWLVHAYERKLPVEEDVYCDFYIPTGKVYIEYWGYENDEKYLNLLGVSEKKELKWELNYYANVEKELSIGKVYGSNKIFVLCNYEDNEFSLPKLYKSIEATIMEENI